MKKPLSTPYPIFFSLFFLIIISADLQGQAYFNPPTNSYNSGTAPTSIITADLDGDGKMDLVTTNSTSNNVSVFLGTGNGNFGAATNFTVGTGPYAVVSADFNGDMKLDLATANNGSNNVSVLLGNGAGSFGAATNFAVGTSPRGITSGDFNGDTKTDLAVANWGSNNISILIGTGTGSFGAPSNFAAGTGPRSIVAAKFNADNFLDLAIANDVSNNASVLIGTGTGSFGAATNFAVGTNPRSIVTADFNGDTKMDLATANSVTNNVSVLLGTGTGSFGAASNFAAGINPFCIITADFDADGKMDLAVSRITVDNYTNISVLTGTGTGSFGPLKSFESTVWTLPSNPFSLAAADFTGDGRPDLAAANNAYNTISILKSYIPPTGGTCPVPMRIVILGASSSFGFNAIPFDSAYAYRFRELIIDSVNGYSEIINLAHAGYTTYAMQANGYPAPVNYPVDTLRNITRAIALNPDGVIFNFTTNDVNALFAMDTIKNNFLRVTNQLNQLGIPFWITTTQPRNFTGDPPNLIAQKKQMLLDLRDTIIMLYGPKVVESYVGFAAANGDLLPQYDSGDNAHFNNAGHLKLFNNFKSKNIPGFLCSQLTGVAEQQQADASVVFPNPFGSSATLRVSSSEKIDNARLSITDVFGREVYAHGSISSGIIPIERGDLPAGIYFYRLVNANKIICEGKLVVQQD